MAIPEAVVIVKARSIRYRKSTTKNFTSAIQWIGLTIVGTFLLWTVAMVIWQATQK